MPFVTHFKDTDGKKLPIAASTLVTVEIPAAGSADKGDWHQAAESATEYYNQQAGHNAPKSSAVIPHCTDPSVFTNHGLRIEYEEQLQGWVLWIDSLPETACTLTLLFINHSTEDTPCVLPALGAGSGGGNIIDLNAFGIDLVTPVFSGGGVFNLDIDHNAFWNMATQESKIRIPLSDKDVILITPSSIGFSTGRVSSIALVFALVNDDTLVRVNVQFMGTFSTSGEGIIDCVGTTVCVIPEMIAVPTM